MVKRPTVWHVTQPSRVTLLGRRLLPGPSAHAGVPGGGPGVAPGVLMHTASAAASQVRSPAHAGRPQGAAWPAALPESSTGRFREQTGVGQVLSWLKMCSTTGRDSDHDAPGDAGKVMRVAVQAAMCVRRWDRESALLEWTGEL